MLLQEYSDSNQEEEGWSFLFCQLNYTLIYFREYPIWTDVAGIQPNKAQIYRLKPLGQFSFLILLRLELKYHSYQKCTLPVKLKNHGE